MPSQSPRVARIFLSSTFRDFGEERDLLVRRVFPRLRAAFRDRFVEIVDVDLRWGITAEQAERGEVLPICLEEIDRSRPFFVGMLGDRYGWVPQAEGYDAELIARHSWLAAHQGGRSVTELEMLYGVLNNPAMAGRAYFYFRDQAYAVAKGGDYVSASAEDRARLDDLKSRIRTSGFPVVEDYSSPSAMAERLEADLYAAIDGLFPTDEVPDAHERTRRLHAAYAHPRRLLHVGAEGALAVLSEQIGSGTPRVLVTGMSGSGKSALLANWAHRWRKAHPEDLVFEHYLGATSEAAGPIELLRRLIETIKRETGSSEEIPLEEAALIGSLPSWLASASVDGDRRGRCWIFLLDGLNGLTALRDLRWFPENLLANVRFVVSLLPGDVATAIKGRGEWLEITVHPLGLEGALTLLRAYLAKFNKKLAPDLEARIMAHPLARVPLFLRTLAEELRVFGVHEALDLRIDHYLDSQTVDDLFERVLERVEGDCGARQVRKAMEGIWASSGGLSEVEIRGFAKLTPADWAGIRHAMGDNLLETAGLFGFTHDYLRIAISDRYLQGNNALGNEGQTPEALSLRLAARTALARWFETQPLDLRTVQEIPYLWQAADEWQRLRQFMLRREVFDMQTADLTTEQIRPWWLVLEAALGLNPEEEYAAVWEGWAPEHDAEETGSTAAKLATLLFVFGRYGDFTVRCGQTALRIVEDRYGPEDSRRSDRLSILGTLLLARADYSSAALLLRRALAIAEAGLGPDHLETRTFLNNLAWLLQQMGDSAGAEPLYLRALAIAEAKHGPDHPKTGMSLNNLALLLTSQGDYAGAEPLFRRALAIAEAARGPDHPETGITLGNLASLLQSLGDYTSAKPLFRRALAIAEAALGPDHPETGTRLNNLAFLLEEMGDYAGAEPLFRRALAVAEAALGPDHPETGITLNNLASLLQILGDYISAEPLLRRALAIVEAAQGPNHSETRITLNNLAWLLQRLGNYTDAEPLLRRALVIAESTENAEDALQQMRRLAVCLREGGQPTESKNLLENAIARAETELGPEHPEIAALLSSYGSVTTDLGEHEVAEAALLRCLALRSATLAPDDPAVLLVRSRLADLYEATDRSHIAAQYRWTDA